MLKPGALWVPVYLMASSSHSFSENDLNLIGNVCLVLARANGPQALCQEIPSYRIDVPSPPKGSAELISRLFFYNHRFRRCTQRYANAFGSEMAEIWQPGYFKR